MGLDPNSRARFNLERASVLLMDASPLGLEILVQVLTGFGAKTLHRALNVDEARDVMQRYAVDLAVVDAGPGPVGHGEHVAALAVGVVDDGVEDRHAADRWGVLVH